MNRLTEVLQSQQRVMISATPAPFMLQLALKGLAHEKIAFFNLETTDDYVGIDDLHPLLIDNEEVFLEQDELTKSSGTDLAFQFVA